MDEKEEKLCRICAHNGQLSSIFNEKNGHRLDDLIRQHLHLTIGISDTSKNICTGCEEKLISFHEYFLMCKRVQHWFSHCDPCESCDEDKKSIDITDNDFYESIFVSEKSINFSPKDDIKIESGYDNDSLSADITNDLLDPNALPNQQFSEESNIVVSESNLNVQERSPAKRTSKSKKVKKRKYDKKNIQFVCSVCDRHCGSWYLLKKHSLSAHGTNASVKCAPCQVVMHSKSVLYRHLTEHNNAALYKCDACPKIVKSSESLEKHKERHVPKIDKIFHCDLCTKTTKTRYSLDKHRTIHIPIEQRQVFSCDICNMKFTTARTVTQHKRVVHDKIKCNMCDLCGYTCATRSELRQHRAVHSNLKLYECNICLKRFKTESNLKTHTDTHEGTSYECEICNKVLNTRRTFRKHKLVHEAVRRFTCSYCNISFKRKQSLQIHMNSHTGDKPISCKWCDERFMYWASLRTHKQRHHPDKILTQ